MTTPKFSKIHEFPPFRFLNDVELKDDAHFKMSSNPEDHSFRIDIKDVTEEMAGKIKVVAVNENGQDQREVNH